MKAKEPFMKELQVNLTSRISKRKEQKSCKRREPMAMGEVRAILECADKKTGNVMFNLPNTAPKKLLERSTDREKL